MKRMKAAAIRTLLLVMLALGGLSTSAVTAGAQVDPIGTVTSVVSTVASQTTVVSGLTTGATSGGSGLTDSVSGATDSVSELGVLSGSGTADSTSSGAGGGSGSTSRGDASSGSATSSNPGSPHTRFDRLPRRYETLLERIESGRHVRANIARLRALLASASPQLRARVLHLIRLEIRRLERAGLTGHERVAAARLRGLLTALEWQASWPATPSPVSLARVESSEMGPATAAAVLGTTADSMVRRAERRPMNGGDGARIASPTPPLPLPTSLSGLLYWLLVLGAITGLLVLLAGASRQWAVAAALVLGLLAGLATLLI
jgi:hypothetical protein